MCIPVCCSSWDNCRFMQLQTVPQARHQSDQASRNMELHGPDDSSEGFKPKRRFLWFSLPKKKCLDTETDWHHNTFFRLSLKNGAFGINKCCVLLFLPWGRKATRLWLVKEMNCNRFLSDYSKNRGVLFSKYQGP